MTYLRRILTAAGVTAASITLLVLAGASPALAQGAANGITNSPHDFSNTTWQTARPGELCRVCHVPHDHQKAATIYGAGLLWNRTLSAGGYTLYGSNTLDGAIGEPDGTAKLCLGCHDGTVALEDFDGNTGGTTFIQDVDSGFRVPGIAGVGKDLSGTHPISVVYDNTADPGLHDPGVATMTGGLTVLSLLDSGNKVQCATCHDVHDGNNEAVAGTHLLRKKNNTIGDPSALCLTCHNK